MEWDRLSGLGGIDYSSTSLSMRRLQTDGEVSRQSRENGKKARPKKDGRSGKLEVIFVWWVQR